ncbi:hypothetical protein NHX12_008949 [Muraenolepis orangiensis]|uniref:Receptor ligand binding region domain-containing protein n=1 Tax=Muraenolepis orangiensis TaxID=630683 RepID=A0A9Q0DQW5_9TELE|nr:hypothetical protein NHX12_008949 [Muraenolepis orangiensis]
MECSRGERLAITLAKDSINRSSNRSTTGKLEVDIFELLRDSQYEMGETMCQIMSKGVVAVLGPSASPASNSIISNICGQKESRPGGGQRQLIIRSEIIVPAVLHR